MFSHRQSNAYESPIGSSYSQPFRRIGRQFPGVPLQLGHVVCRHWTPRRTLPAIAICKGIAELRILQTNRASPDRKLDPEEAAEVPAITSINDLTKQTQSEATASAIEMALMLTDIKAGVLVGRTRTEFGAEMARRIAARENEAR